MTSLLIALIYVSFISLGLPDSMLGSAWPVMHETFGASLSAAGVITMIISGGTIISSLLSDRLTRRFGTGAVTVTSVAMTALALLGFSLSHEMWQLCLWAIPYGLGAGAVDAALNNYVALHLASRHMSWLHACWGVGAAISPNIMSMCLAGTWGWRGGYRVVAVIQTVLVAVLLFSLPLWGKQSETDRGGKTDAAPLGLRGALKIPGVLWIMLAFFGYCAMESTAGLWAASYLTEYRGVGEQMAANFASFYYIGIMIGRFFNGLIADRMGDRRMIRVGILGAILGIVMIMLPLTTNVVALVGLIVAGVGSAPIYPSIIHSTPDNFGAENSQAIVGIQMASAYVGATFMPPLFGLLGQYINIGLYPFYLAVFAILMLVTTERLFRMKR